MDSDDKSGPALNTTSQVESNSASGENPMPRHNIFEHGNAQVVGRSRASDLLMSVLVCSEVYKPKIIDVAVAAAIELAQMASEKQPLWVFDQHKEREVLNAAEYKRKFGDLEITLKEVIRIIVVGDDPNFNINGNDQVSREGAAGSPFQPPPPVLQTEASRATGMVLMHPISLVHMMMNVEKWLTVFSNIVSKARVLGVISTGEALGNPNGALQVMTAEFHVPSPLVRTREMYFARYCKQLDVNTWVVVDVSLESVFPNPILRCQRRPSGCLIQRTQNGLSQVTWVEHNEVDSNSVHNLFMPLVISGFAFTANRWVCTLERQCDRFRVLMEQNSILEGGRKSILLLAQRMSQSYNVTLGSSWENLWRRMPIDNAEDILVKTILNLDDPGSPPGVAITVATSVWLPLPAKDMFEFLRSGNSRGKWDILSYGCVSRDIAQFSTGRDLSNRVSIVFVEGATMMLYLQESYSDSTGYYVVYAPVDMLAMNAMLDGGNPDNVAILASGFTVVPSLRAKKGSILTVAFQIVDESLESPQYLPPQSVSALYKLITQTVSMIKAAFIPR